MREDSLVILSTELFRFFVRLLLSTLAFLVIIYLLQDFLIFPSARTGIFGRGTRTAKLPRGVSAHTVTTADNEQLELWHYQPHDNTLRDTVVIIFHGNGGTVDGFFGYQQWLGSIGLRSYSFDYRGYGYSSGWPSEQGLYLDAEAIWEFVKTHEGQDDLDVILMGISIGSGPAAYLATHTNPRILMLLSGYSSLPELAREKPVYRYLAWLLRYDLPVAGYIARLKSTCLILAHGKRDTIISYSNLAQLEQSYSGDAGVHTVIAPNAGHNDLFPYVHRELATAIKGCLQPAADEPVKK